MTADPAHDAVLFDMDGVLVDSTTSHVRAWTRFLDEYGIPPPAEGIPSLFGRRAAEAVADLVGADVGSEVARAALARLEGLADELLRATEPGALVVVGVPVLVERLASDGWRLAVATSARRSAAEYSLGDLIGSFGTLVSADDVTHGKPHPEVYLVAAERLGVRPATCIVVEDATAGVRAGKRAGMSVVGVASTATPERLTEAGADEVIDRVTVLPEVIERWHSAPHDDTTTPRRRSAMGGGRTMAHRTVTLTNPSGLHARRAKVFAEAAADLDVEVTVAMGEREVNAASVLSVLTLDCRQGDTITIRAEGDGAEVAVGRLAGLVVGGLGEAT